MAATVEGVQAAAVSCINQPVAMKTGGNTVMSHSTTSMFYFFVIVIAIYFVGISVYQIFQFMKKWLRKRR